MSGFADLHWNQLLDFIEAGTVVPVVGRELLWTEIQGRHQDVYGHIAMRLSAELEVDPPARTARDPVSDVVQRYLATRQDPAWPYAVVFKMVKEFTSVEPPASLLKLSEIGFPLVISTTFEGFLERAAERFRPEPASRLSVKSYFLNSDTDLDAFGNPGDVVFNLLGRACPTPDYALTDADVLEFVRQFHRGRPSRLLDTLGQRHLLLIGSGFSDWLTRFFLRMARPANSRLWMNLQGLTHYIASCNPEEGALKSYLQHPLSASRLFPENDARLFVDHLYDRWRSRHPQSLGRHAVAQPVRLDSPGRGVFLSYAHADAAAAETVRSRLDSSGLDVWFDKRELHAGEDWDRKIRRALDESSLFVPLVSANILTDAPDRYFRAEWRLAEIRAQRAPFNIPYIFPLVIDATDLRSTQEYIPQSFVHTQWTTAPNGAVPDEFLGRLKEAYRRLQRPEAGRT